MAFTGQCIRCGDDFDGRKAFLDWSKPNFGGLHCMFTFMNTALVIGTRTFQGLAHAEKFGPPPKKIFFAKQKSVAVRTKIVYNAFFVWNKSTREKRRSIIVIWM